MSYFENIQVQDFTSGFVLAVDSSGAITANVGTTGGLFLDSTFTTRINTLGQKTMANSTPVVLASDQTVIPVSDNGGSLTVDGTIAATQSGTWNINNISGTISLPTGAATETTLAAIKTDADKFTFTSTRLLVDGSGVTQPVSGTVTANIGTTNGLALDATLAKLTISQGTALGTNTGAMVMGSVTTAAPTYTTGQISPLSLSTTGALRVDNSGVTQPISAASLPLPTGAATEATLGTLLLNSTFTGRINTLGQKTMANSTPVVLASDQTVIPVSDNGGSLTVDGTVGATQSGTWTVQPGNTANTTPWLTTINQGGNSATVTASNALKVDGSAVTQPVSGTVTANIGTTNGLALDATLTGGTQKAIIRSGVKGTSTAQDVTSTASGANHQILDVAIYDAAGNQITTFGGGTQFADGAARGTATGTLAMGDDGTNIQSLSCDTTGKLNINNISGTISLPTGAATETSLAKLTLAQGSTTSGQTGPLMLGAVTTAAPAYTTAQSSPLSLDTSGRLRIDNSSWLGSTAPTVGSKTSANSIPVVIASDQGNVPVSQATAANLNAQVVGTVASGSADAGNPVKIGGVAITALPTAVTNGQRSNIVTDKFGRQVVLVGTIRDLTGRQTTTISASTAETTVVTAGGAGVFNDLVMLVISNTSASTNTRIDFRDTTGGAVLFSLQSIGGGAPVGFALPVPIPQTGANTNWTAQCASSTTDIRIFAVFAKNQ